MADQQNLRIHTTELQHDERKTYAIQCLKATAPMPRAYTHLLPLETTAKSYAGSQVLQQKLKELLEHAARIEQHGVQAVDTHAHVHSMEQQAPVKWFLYAALAIAVGTHLFLRK